MTSPGPDLPAPELIYDWNEVGRKGRLIPKGVTFFDETLRDGLQNPSVADPRVEAKLKLLHLMDKIGIHVADIGLPGSSPRAFADVLRMCREITDNKLGLKVACAGRTVVSDITPMVEISQRAGVPIEVYAFIGSSPIRQLAEEWDLPPSSAARPRPSTSRSRPGSPSATSPRTPRAPGRRSSPRSSRWRSITAPRASASPTRSATPRPTACTTSSPSPSRSSPAPGATVGVDWHGHNDRGLALENALWALEFGANRVHGTALGIGERVGNAQMELILLNLKLLGLLDGQDLTHLLEYCNVAAEAVGWQVPINYPLVGRDAFRTATGVHAAAIIKAEAKGNAWLADRIYSGVPAGMFGRKQEICVGYMSGASNVNYWLRQRKIEPSKELVDAILARAKGTDHILADEEILAVIEQVRGR